MKPLDKRTLKAIGKMLWDNKMDKVSDSNCPNPLYSVWIYKDEIQELKKGRLPDGFEIYC